MPNALSSGGLPPPPMPAAQSEVQPANPLAVADGGAPAAAGGEGAAAMPAPRPAPTHKQTVAALRHLHAVSRELQTLLRNPDLGKASIKSSIIDGATKLVADGILSPAQAVMQLGSVPEKPFEQKQWLENLFRQNMGAEVAILDHHREAHQGSGDWAVESGLHDDRFDDHAATIDGMMSAHYGGGSKSRG